jgi:hypothetical protein
MNHGSLSSHLPQSLVVPYTVQGRIVVVIGISGNSDSVPHVTRHYYPVCVANLRCMIKGPRFMTVAALDPHVVSIASLAAL